MSGFGSQKRHGRSSLSIATGHFFWFQRTLHTCGAQTHMQTNSNEVLIGQTHNFVPMLFLLPVLFTCHILCFCCCGRIPKDTNSKGVEGRSILVRVAEVSVNDSLALFCDLEHLWEVFGGESGPPHRGQEEKREKRVQHFRDPRMIWIPSSRPHLRSSTTYWKCW